MSHPGKVIAMQTTYSHAAPYIREAILMATERKLNATTIRERREHSGQMYGLTHALTILLNSPEGKDSPQGYPEFFGVSKEFFGVSKERVLTEVERYLGGPDQMRELGFVNDVLSYIKGDDDGNNAA